MRGDVPVGCELPLSDNTSRAVVCPLTIADLSRDQLRFGLRLLRKYRSAILVSLFKPSFWSAYYLSINHIAAMAASQSVTENKLAHYRAWSKAWVDIEPSTLPAEQCLAIVVNEGPIWLHGRGSTETGSIDRITILVSCFKAATRAQLVLLGGRIPPSRDEYNVLSESYDARTDCTCSGVLFPVPSGYDASNLRNCGCKAVERMISEGDLINSMEDQWNNSTFFSSAGLCCAMAELALCHADMEPNPSCCHGEQSKPAWSEVRAPDRKPNPEVDLDEETYNSLYPTSERIRLSADAKYFFASASGASRVDPGIQMAISDSGNDILIADYCEAASENSLAALQKQGAAAFSFLKICVYAGLVTDWHFDLLVAQVVQFRIIGYWRDHAVSRLPRGVWGSCMTALSTHRHIDLGIAVGVVSASIATGQTMTAEGHRNLVDTFVLFNDLVDFRGDTWRNQRENVVLRGVRGCLCSYLDGLLSRCIRGAAALIRRGEIFAFNIMAFCNWMLMGSGHKVYEITRGTDSVGVDSPCCYKSKDDGAYEELLETLESYPVLEEDGPHVTMKRKDLQALYAKHRLSSQGHIMWLADVVRVVLHPENLRRLVDVVHHPWSGELGEVDYCA
jgi:hypothetical protein